MCVCVPSLSLYLSLSLSLSLSLCLYSLSLLSLFSSLLSLSQMSGKGKSKKHAFSSKSFEVFPPVEQLEHPVTKKSLPTDVMAKFAEVQLKTWKLTMESSDTVMYMGVQVGVIMHLRIQKCPDGRPTNSRWQFKTVISNPTVKRHCVSLVSV